MHEESELDDELAVALSELRLVKDEFEIAQLQLAVDATVKGFRDVVRALPSALDRGERVIEGSLQPSRPRRGKRHRLRDDRGEWTARDDPALGAQHR